MPIYLQIEAKLRMIRILWKAKVCSAQIQSLNQEVIALYAKLATEPDFNDQVDCWS